MTWIVLFFAGLLVWLFFGKSKNKRKPAKQRPSGSAEAQRDVKRKKAPNPSFRITYRDQFGDVTTRVIEPYGLGNHETFDAYCNLRNEGRTFYYRGVEACEDAKSGHDIDPQTLFRLSSPDADAPLEILWSSAWRIVCPMLIFIRTWRPSGVREKERTAIIAGVREAIGAKCPDDEILHKLLKIRTTGINLAYYTGRLLPMERQACLSIAQAISTPDSEMMHAAVSEFT